MPESYIEVLNKSPMAQMQLQSLEKQLSPEPELIDAELIPGSVRYIIGEGDSTSTSPLTSPGLISPAEPSLYSPDGVIQDANTQLSLVERSEGLQLEDPMDSSTFWSIVGTEKAPFQCKKNAHKLFEGTAEGEVASRTSQFEGDETKQGLFDTAGFSSQQFVFTKFGSDVSNGSFGQEPKTEPEASDAHDTG